MIKRTLYLLTLAGGLTAAVVGGCGGKVIVDGVANEGGQGGQGGRGTSNEATSGTAISASSVGGSTCGFPPPVGTQMQCGSSGTGSSGMTFCGVTYCDQAGNRYDANCVNNTCTCTAQGPNGALLGSCTCTLSGMCSNSPSCCPFTP